MAWLFVMHSDFVSLCLPPCLFSDSATFPNLFLYLSFPALCLNPLELLFLQPFCVLSSLFLFLSLFSFVSFSLIPIFFFSYIFLFPLVCLPFQQTPLLLFFNLHLLFYSLFLSFHTSLPMFASLPPSLLLLAPSTSATVLLFQLRPQLFPPSAPSFSWRCSPPLPGAPSLPRFGGQPADVAQHLFLLHRQGEVMSRLASFAQSECVCLSL